MKLRHTSLMTISGALWLIVGTSLLIKGLQLLVASGQTNQGTLINQIGFYVGSGEYAAVVLIALSLFIGYMKGKHVLAKTVQRCVNRIQSFPNPTSLTNIYSRGYYFLLAGMIGLGMCTRLLGFPDDLRGIIDTAVGAALIQGAIHYFRATQKVRVPLP